jgi:hypothetical protein
VLPPRIAPRQYSRRRKITFSLLLVIAGALLFAAAIVEFVVNPDAQTDLTAPATTTTAPLIGQVEAQQRLVQDSEGGKWFVRIVDLGAEGAVFVMVPQDTKLEGTFNLATSQRGPDPGTRFFIQPESPAYIKLPIEMPLAEDSGIEITRYDPADEVGTTP